MAKKQSFKEIINSEKPTLIDFYATWCGPCKMMSPILENLKENMGDQMRVVKIDVDRNQKLAQALRVQGVPTLVLYKKGKIVWRESGVKTVPQLTKVITPHLN